MGKKGEDYRILRVKLGFLKKINCVINFQPTILYLFNQYGSFIFKLEEQIKQHK